MKRIKLPSIDCDQVSREIGEFIINTVLEIGTTGCVVGMSGGVDSSVTAALIKSAFEDHYKNTFDLVGYILPSSVNSMDDARDAEAVANHLEIRHEVHNIEDLVQAFRITNPEAFENDYDRGNMISRIRANVLSTKAATEKKIVAGTGNKDEDFGIGYYTLFGDGAVHISPIAGLSKRLVREMAQFLSLSENIVHREPTAGLEPGQSDFKDLGYDYDVVELVTEGLEQGLTAAQLVDHEQVKPLVEKQMGHHQKVYGIIKFQTVKDVIEDILKRHSTAKNKVKIIHPPTPEITLQYR